MLTKGRRKTRELGAGLASRPSFRFAPEVGAWRVRLPGLARVAKKNPPQLKAEVERLLQEVLEEVESSESASADRVRFGFALSVLDDLLVIGGSVYVIDSEIFVSWPDWHASNGRDVARLALEAVQPKRPFASLDLSKLDAMFPSVVAPATLERFMMEADFWLEPASERHPSGQEYSVAFAAGLRNWTMPYRGRSGRSRRFVVVGQSAVISNQPQVVGLIEIGDEAPFSTDRDLLLSLHPRAFLEWFESEPERIQIALGVAQDFQALRTALRPVDGFDSTCSLDDVLASESAIHARALGRSQSAEGHGEKKRLAYLLRLAHGEQAMLRLAEGRPITAEDAALREGVRAIHDLTVPRTHMEVTVCGAVPPFDHALGGKLVAAFLGHPLILGATRGGPGEIVQNLFQVEKLNGLLPDWGMLALTTKGLYPGHSALYNRAEVPGANGQPQRLRKLGETRGESTTLLSSRTARLAQRLLENARPTGGVALVYGTGGSKRMRYMESAAVESGLPKQLVHAGIRRPVYGLKLASNIEEVVWRHAVPRWLVDPNVDPAGYSAAAAELWRDRWGGRASSRSARDGDGILGLLPSIGVDD